MCHDTLLEWVATWATRQRRRFCHHQYWLQIKVKVMVVANPLLLKVWMMKKMSMNTWTSYRLQKIMWQLLDSIYSYIYSYIHSCIWLCAWICCLYIIYLYQHIMTTYIHVFVLLFLHCIYTNDATIILNVGDLIQGIWCVTSGVYAQHWLGFVSLNKIVMTLILANSGKETHFFNNIM